MFTNVTSYFDASGGRDQPAMIVAGYVATIAQWEAFDVAWRSVLSSNEVPYFHMKEFAHFQGPFETWRKRERKRRRFLNALIEVISNNLGAGFACGIKQPIWDEMNEQYPLVEVFGCPYALCGRDSVNKTYVWGRKQGRTDGEIRTVFEEGDRGKGHLIRVVEETAKSSPSFERGRPHKQNDYRGVTPLQAADFPAYELLKTLKDGKDQSQPDEWRVPLQKLAKAVPVSWTKYEQSDVVALCKAGKVAPRSKPRGE